MRKIMMILKTCRRLWQALPMIVGLTLFVGCSSDDDPEWSNAENGYIHAYGIDEDVAVNLVPTNQLPAWLIEHINKKLEFRPVNDWDKVYKGTLNGKTVYYIFDMLSSCMNCEFYYEDGSTVPERELYNVRNWTCVYSVTPYVEGLTGTLHYIPQSPYVQTAQDARDHYIEIGSARYYIWGIHNSNKLKKFDGKTVTFGGFNYGDITSDVTDAPPGVTCYGFEATYIR